jgi:hypothetical protein
MAVGSLVGGLLLHGVSCFFGLLSHAVHVGHFLGRSKSLYYSRGLLRIYSLITSAVAPCPSSLTKGDHGAEREGGRRHHPEVELHEKHQQMRRALRKQTQDRAELGNVDVQKRSFSSHVLAVLLTLSHPIPAANRTPVDDPCPIENQPCLCECKAKRRTRLEALPGCFTEAIGS